MTHIRSMVLTLLGMLFAYAPIGAEDDLARYLPRRQRHPTADRRLPPKSLQSSGLAST